MWNSEDFKSCSPVDECNIHGTESVKGSRSQFILVIYFRFIKKKNRVSFRNKELVISLQYEYSIWITGYSVKGTLPMRGRERVVMVSQDAEINSISTWYGVQNFRKFLCNLVIFVKCLEITLPFNPQSIVEAQVYLNTYLLTGQRSRGVKKIWSWQ